MEGTAHNTELDSKKKATIITIIVNVLVLVGIYFIVVWRPPVPPMAQFGLELNLGFTDAGSGNEQTETPPSESEQINTESPAPGTPVESPDPVQPEAQPVAQPESQPKPTESKSSYETRSNTASPLKGSEKSKEAVKEPEQPKEEAKPVTKPAKKEEKKVEEKVEEKPTIDQRAIFGAGGNKGKSSQSSAGSNQGNSTQKGDQGNPEGTIDGRSLMQSGQGNAGNGAGYNLDLAG